MAEIEITHDETETKGRYVARVPGAAETGELTYSKAGTARIIVDHTGVPDALRGTGVGAALAARVVVDAREKGLRITPLCPFFRSQAQRHPEWSDVVDR